MKFDKTMAVQSITGVKNMWNCTATPHMSK
jgi:hypothetical protein